MVTLVLKQKYYSLVILTFLLSSCQLFSPGISQFDHYSYVQTTSVKVDILNLINLATEEYQEHQKVINDVNTIIQKIVEYEKHRPKNELTIQQWETLTDTTGNLYGGFIVRWKLKRKLGADYLHEKKIQIGRAIDQIAELESGKIKPKDIK